MLTANEARIKQIVLLEEPRVVEELVNINAIINNIVHNSKSEFIKYGSLSINTRKFLERIGYDVSFCASEDVWYISWR
jgi:hypothetical protein